MVGFASAAMGAAPVFGGAMLAFAAGQFRGQDLRGMIKQDMDLLDRLPPDATERRADLQRSIDFYVKGFGMTEIRRNDVPDGKYTLAFVGYGTEENSTVIELTYNYGVNKYDTGTAFGHLAVGVPDVAATTEKLRAFGAKVTREPGPVKFGKTIIAFVEDPDGYKIELVQRD